MLKFSCQRRWGHTSSRFDGEIEIDKDEDASLSSLRIFLSFDLDVLCISDCGRFL